MTIDYSPSRSFHAFCANWLALICGLESLYDELDPYIFYMSLI